MSIQISNYTFEGPHTSENNLKDASGVYMILCQSNGKYYPVDVGESATVKSRVENHERQNCWKRNCSSTLMVAVLYTPPLQQAGRREIEQKIRNQFNFPCGKE
ncbi:MAG: hypothetical protein RDU59_08425 [Thermodesulfobacteriota bacterium]|nr:hypothetical protein [Thermodesulfobacteriota bacterium]